MKHLKTITAGSPAKANDFQDFFCEINGIIAGLLGAFGAAAPLVDYFETKCNPVPPGETPTS